MTIIAKQQAFSSSSNIVLNVNMHLSTGKVLAAYSVCTSLHLITYFLCEQLKLARQFICAGSSEPSLLGMWYVSNSHEVVYLMNNIVHLLLNIPPIVCGVLCLFLSNAFLGALSSFAILMTKKRELVTLLKLSSWCIVTVSGLWLFLTLSLVVLQQCVLVVISDHTQLLFRHIKWPNLDFSLWVDAYSDYTM